MVEGERVMRLIGGRHRGTDDLPVSIVDAGEALLEGGLEPGGLEAEDPVQLLRPAESAAAQVPFPIPDVGDQLRFGQTLPIRAQSLRPLAKDLGPLVDEGEGVLPAASEDLDQGGAEEGGE